METGRKGDGGQENQERDKERSNPQKDEEAGWEQRESTQRGEAEGVLVACRQLIECH